MHKRKKQSPVPLNTKYCNHIFLQLRTIQFKEANTHRVMNRHSVQNIIYVIVEERREPDEKTSVQDKQQRVKVIRPQRLSGYKPEQWVEDSEDGNYESIVFKLRGYEVVVVVEGIGHRDHEVSEIGDIVATVVESDAAREEDAVVVASHDAGVACLAVPARRRAVDGAVFAENAVRMGFLQPVIGENTLHHIPRHVDEQKGRYDRVEVLFHEPKLVVLDDLRSDERHFKEVEKWC